MTTRIHFMGGGMLDVAESPDEVQNLLTIKANGRPIQMNADHRGGRPTSIPSPSPTGT